MNNLKMDANVYDPLFRRDFVEELTGDWEFSFDGVKWQPINLPYCPQSALSGIGYTDFIPECHYRKTFSVDKNRGRALLRFGAVDYEAHVFINGKFVGSHKGGFTPFTFDITDYVTDGENHLALTVYDPNAEVPYGKQSFKKQSWGCFYTRTTGIWQPVTLEYAPIARIKEFYFYPDIANCAVTVDLAVVGTGRYDIEVYFDGKVAGSASGEIEFRKSVTVPLSVKKLWKLGEGNLYDVRITFGEDTVRSYFGLREVRYDGMKFMLNGEEVFQKLVLDQGFYPDGIYTAPSIDAMEKDIAISLELGFNGARLHQKVFDPRFLYLCDKAGYMVWGEFPSWGVNYGEMTFVGEFLAQWRETVQRDFNHPSIITWCPLNENWSDWYIPKRYCRRDRRFVDAVYEFTKLIDTTRPCVDVSGGHHGRKTDVFDFHCYEKIDNIRKYINELENQDKLEIGSLYSWSEDENDLHYKKGVPVNISEYGGIAFIKDKVNHKAPTSGDAAVQYTEAWGYGEGENDGNAFVERYRELTEAIFACKKLSGFCYTQLYDVEQEQNGLYNYDRSDKLSEEQKRQIRMINAER